MARSWFDALEEKGASVQRPSITAIDGDKEENVTDLLVESDDDADVEESSARGGKSSRSAQPWILGGVVAGAAVICVAAVATVISSLSGSQGESVAQQPGVAESRAASTMTQEQTLTPTVEAAADLTQEVATVGPSCANESKGVGEEDSLRTAVTEFETAYFARDVDTLLGATAEQSPLRGQDWKSVLAEAAPDGTGWCVEMQPASEDGSMVDVDVSMALPGQEENVYKQTFKGEKSADGWKVQSIEPREG
ncbi:hypothetical protein [Corynebacterium sanguinis]|uniref:hypothetical protein n=1 Tax=Corynebacterium sanguinis TaxID=2594913 RepID=UPI001643ECFF|nr:hypothetical protein [Corynebacterium sanguinis]